MDSKMNTQGTFTILEEVMSNDKKVTPGDVSLPTYKEKYRHYAKTPYWKSGWTSRSPNM